MHTLPIPAAVVRASRSDPMAVIRFLKRLNTTAVQDRPEELLDLPVSTPAGPMLRPVPRGYGGDCTCWGTGWKHGQVLCGRHIPRQPLSYYVRT